MVGVLLVVLAELEIFGRNISARLEIDERPDVVALANRDPIRDQLTAVTSSYRADLNQQYELVCSGRAFSRL